MLALTLSGGAWFTRAMNWDSGIGLVLSLYLFIYLFKYKLTKYCSIPFQMQLNVTLNGGTCDACII